MRLRKKYLLTTHVQEAPLFNYGLPPLSEAHLVAAGQMTISSH